MNTHDFVTTWILRSTYIGIKDMNSNHFSTIFMQNLRFNRFVHILTYIYISNVWNQLLSPKCRSFSLNFDQKNYQLYFKATYCLSYLDNFLVISAYISISYAVSMLSPMYDNFRLILTQIWISYVGIILNMGSANEKRRYNVTSSLIAWAHTQNDPCYAPRLYTASHM